MAFFTAAGRLRRRGYFFRVLGLYALAIGIYALPGQLYEATIPVHITSVAVLAFFAIAYLVLIQGLLRLHDLNLSSWWALVLLLPVVSYILGGGMQLVQGTIGPNRFGPDSKRPDLLPILPVAPVPVADGL